MEFKNFVFNTVEILDKRFLVQTFWVDQRMVRKDI